MSFRPRLLVFGAAISLFAGGLSSVWGTEVTVPGVLIVDDDTDPFGRGEPRGAVVLSRYEGPSYWTATNSPGLVDPVGTLMLPDRTLYIVDESADPLGTGTRPGAIFHTDPALLPNDSFVTTVLASALFKDPADMLLDPEGRIILADRSADPYRLGRNLGAIFRSDPETGNVEVLGHHPDFEEPRSLAWDTDGQILILDTLADPNQTFEAPGALFRLDPETGEVTIVKAFDRKVVRRAMAVAVLPDGDYAIVDRDADPRDLGGSPGVVFRLDRNTGEMSTFYADDSFVDPIDVVMGKGDELWVLDAKADPDGHSGSVGATFRYDIGLDLTTYFRATSLVKSPRGLSFATGPNLGTSSIEYVDESGGSLEPGNLVTVRVSVQNDGVTPAVGASFFDELGTDWDFVSGSVFAESGVIHFDPESRQVLWTGDVSVDATVELSYRVKTPTGLESGTEFSHTSQVSVSGKMTSFTEDFVVLSSFEPGTTVFLDQRTVDGESVGLLCRIVPDETDPFIEYYGAPLKAPEDLVFLPDGRLVILDRKGGDVAGPGGNHAIFVFDRASGQMTRAWQRAEGDSLRDPTGITLLPSGKLLLVDRDANPFDLPYTPDPFAGDLGPGAVFEVDIETGESRFLFSDERMREPIDIEVDSEGTVLVIDYVGVDGGGDLWEFDPTTEIVSRRQLNDVWFRDPAGMTLDENDNAYIADITHFSDEETTDTTNNGAVLQVIRESPTRFSIRSQSGLLVDPVDCFLDGNGILYISDRDANPRMLETLDTGAIFSIDTRGADQNLKIASASYSIVRPSGLAAYEPPGLAVGNIVMVDRNGGGAVANDTLDIRIQIQNLGEASADGTFVELNFGDRLELKNVDAPGGVVGVDTASGQASWTGSIGAGELMILEAELEVVSDAIFGERTDVSIGVEGGGERFDRTKEIRLAGAFGRSDVLVSDSSSDPKDAGDSPGALFRLGEAGEPPAVVFSGFPTVEITALEWSPSGDVVIADRNGSESGFIFSLGADTGSFRTLLQSDDRVGAPNDILWTPTGDLLVLDRDYQFPGQDGRGAIFRLPGGEGPAEFFATSDDWQFPTSFTLTPSGRLFVADRRADPNGLGGNTGAVFEVHLTTGAILSIIQDEEFVEPTGLLALSDDTILVTDHQANPRNFPSQTGAVYSLDIATEELTLFASSSDFVSPYRTAQLPDGSFLVLDQAASSSEQTGFPGLIFALDPITRSVSEYAVSDDFLVPSDILVQPSSSLSLAEYTAEDADGAGPLRPSDKVRFSARIENSGVRDALGATFVDQMPDGVDLLSNTITASTGVIRIEGEQLLWEGDVAMGGEVILGYEAQLDPLTTEGMALAFDPVLTGPTVGEQKGEARLGVYVPFESGFIYAVDSDADPLGTGSPRGAILKINQYTGTVRHFFGSTEWREPVDLTLVGDTAPQFYLVDSQIRESGQPGAGVVYRVDPELQQLEQVARSDDFLQLTAILGEGDDHLLVLDSWADPNGLTPTAGPGALFRIPLSTGIPELVYSDTTLSRPEDMAWMSDGSLAILDSRADPDGTGNEPGALFRLDLTSLSLEIIATNPSWVDPVAVAMLTNNTAWIVDRGVKNTNGGTGAIWRYEDPGRVSFIEGAGEFRDLRDVWFPGDHRPIVLDAEAAPNASVEGRGSIFRGDGSTAGHFQLFSSTTDMVEPQAMVVYQDITPVVSMRASASATADGIEVTWSGRSAEPDTRYLLYRKAVDGPDTEPQEDSMEGYEMVTMPRTYQGPGEHKIVDHPALDGGWYAYRVILVYSTGETDFSQPIYGQAPLTSFSLQLSLPRPNPFGASTSLRFSIPETSEVRLNIFDVAGRKVRSLVDGELEAGEHEVAWAGRSSEGRRLASGVYFAKLEFGERSRTQRIVLSR